MNLDEWDGDCAESIANRETAVRVGPGVDDDAVDVSPERVDRVNQLALTVMLRELNFSARFAGHRPQRSLHVRQGLTTVQFWLTGAEEVQVRAIDDRNPHVFFNPLSHALNCAMSSVPSVGGVLVGGDAGDEVASPEKN